MKKKSWDQFWKDYHKPSEAEKWLILERDKIINNAISENFGRRKIKILEVGCGYASNSRLLSKKEKINVFCLDSSDEIINKIKKDIKNTYNACAENTGFADNQFDVVFSSGLIEHFKDPSKIINEQIRILKKGGLLITIVPGKYSLWQIYRLSKGRNWQHGYEESYDEKKMKKVLNFPSLRIIKIGGIDPFSINGILLKIFRFKTKINKSFPSAYTEIYSVAKKM